MLGEIFAKDTNTIVHIPVWTITKISCKFMTNIEKEII
jgi:hypothetical protein